MIKYLKYYFSILLAFLAMFSILMGTYYPTIFLFLFSLVIIAGDSLIKPDKKLQSFSYPFFLDLSIYLALPVLFILMFFVISIFSNSLPAWYILGFKDFFNIDFIHLQQSFNAFDKISIIMATFLDYLLTLL